MYNFIFLNKFFLKKNYIYINIYIIVFIYSFFRNNNYLNNFSNYFLIISHLNTKENLIILTLLLLFILINLQKKINVIIYLYLYNLCIELNNSNEVFFNFENYFSTFNIKLINGFMLIHPIILYVGYSLIFFLIISSYKDFFFFCTKKYFYKRQRHLYLTTVILIISTILGCLWANMELFWGGWWSWDMIEILNLIVLLFFINFLHLQKKYKFYKKKQKLIFISFFLLIIIFVRFNLINSFHSFIIIENQKHYDNYIYIYILLCMFFFLQILFNKLLFFKFNVFFVTLKIVLTILVFSKYINIVLLEDIITLTSLKTIVLFFIFFLRKSIYIYIFIFLKIDFYINSFFIFLFFLGKNFFKKGFVLFNIHIFFVLIFVVIAIEKNFIGLCTNNDLFYKNNFILNLKINLFTKSMYIYEYKNNFFYNNYIHLYEYNKNNFIFLENYENILEKKIFFTNMYTFENFQDNKLFFFTLNVCIIIILFITIFLLKFIFVKKQVKNF